MGGDIGGGDVGGGGGAGVFFDTVGYRLRNISANGVKLNILLLGGIAAVVDVGSPGSSPIIPAEAEALPGFAPPAPGVLVLLPCRSLTLRCGDGGRRFLALLRKDKTSVSPGGYTAHLLRLFQLGPGERQE